MASLPFIDDSLKPQTFAAFAPTHERGHRVPNFEAVYAECFDFVWRSARRMGVPEDALDDVTQEVFVIVYRTLNDFEGRSTIKTYVFSILLRIVRNYKRSRRRKDVTRLGNVAVDPDAVTSQETGPHEQALRSQAARILHQLLQELDEDKRAIFILAELEDLPATEIAQVLDVNPNTVYSRLRAARREFDQAVCRYRARTSNG